MKDLREYLCVIKFLHKDGDVNVAFMVNSKFTMDDSLIIESN